MIQRLPSPRSDHENPRLPPLPRSRSPPPVHPPPSPFPPRHFQREREREGEAARRGEGPERLWRSSSGGQRAAASATASEISETSSVAAADALSSIVAAVVHAPPKDFLVIRKEWGAVGIHTREREKKTFGVPARDSVRIHPPLLAAAASPASSGLRVRPRRASARIALSSLRAEGGAASSHSASPRAPVGERLPLRPRRRSRALTSYKGVEARRVPPHRRILCRVDVRRGSLRSRRPVLLTPPHRPCTGTVGFLFQVMPMAYLLLGFCNQDDHRMLVYEYMHRGSLENHLFNNPLAPLPWLTQLKIAVGVAKGLAFLH